jgi:hypothetical protein
VALGLSAIFHTEICQHRRSMIVVLSAMGSCSGCLLAEASPLISRETVFLLVDAYARQGASHRQRIPGHLTRIITVTQTAMSRRFSRGVRVAVSTGSERFCRKTIRGIIVRVFARGDT